MVFLVQRILGMRLIITVTIMREVNKWNGVKFDLLSSFPHNAEVVKDPHITLTTREGVQIIVDPRKGLKHP